MSYFVKEADGNFHYSYYGVVDRVMAEYVNPQKPMVVTSELSCFSCRSQLQAPSPKMKSAFRGRTAHAF